MYNRVMRKKVTKENYRYMQRKGRQNLKVLLILFYMFLLCYSVINYFMVKMLFLQNLLHRSDLNGRKILIF